MEAFTYEQEKNEFNQAKHSYLEASINGYAFICIGKKLSAREDLFSKTRQVLEYSKLEIDNEEFDKKAKEFPEQLITFILALDIDYLLSGEK